MVAKIAYPESFSHADRTLNGRTKVKIGHNTWLERRDAGRIAIIYHRTAIVSLYADGRVVLDNGGYYTRTTLYRVSRALAALGIGSLSARKDEWRVHYRDGHGAPFERNMDAAAGRRTTAADRDIVTSVIGMARLRVVSN